MFLFPKPTYNENNLEIFKNNIFMIPKNIFVENAKISKTNFGKLNDITNKKYNSVNFKENKDKDNYFNLNITKKKELLNNDNYIKDKYNSLNNLKNILSYTGKKNVNKLNKQANTVINSNCKFNFIFNSEINNTNSIKFNRKEYRLIKNKSYKYFNCEKSELDKKGYKFINEKLKLNKQIHYMDNLNKINKDNNLKNKKINNFKEKFSKNLNCETVFPILLFTTYEFGLGCSNNVTILFHGNSEDMFGCSRFAKKLCFNLKSNVIVMEYPGYSIFKGEPNESWILKNSLHLYDYLKALKVDKIVLIGRSIGTGPASYLARFRKIHSLILISPFWSIKDVIKSHISKYLSWVIKQRFNNLKRIIKINVPVWIIHGNEDKLIPISHSKLLKKEYLKSKLNLSERKFIFLKEFINMTHYIKDMNVNIINPILTFFSTLKEKNIF